MGFRMHIPLPGPFSVSVGLPRLPRYRPSRRRHHQRQEESARPKPLTPKGRVIAVCAIAVLGYLGAQMSAAVTHPEPKCPTDVVRSMQNGC